MNNLNNISTEINSYLGNVNSTVILIICGWFLAGIIRRIVHNANLEAKFRVNNAVFSTSAYFLALTFVFISALKKLGVDKVVELTESGTLLGVITYPPNIISIIIAGFLTFNFVRSATH